MRITAPPIMWPCYLGVDLASRSELIAARMSVPEIGKHIGVESIQYLTLDGLIQAIDNGGSGFCTGCFTGRYPVDIDLSQTKYALEELAAV